MFALDVDVIWADFCVSSDEGLAREEVGHSCGVHYDFDAFAVAVVT